MSERKQKARGAVKVLAEVELLMLPMLPNYLRYVGAESNSLDVAHMTDGLLKEIGKRWTEALIAHAHDRKRKQEARK